MKLSTSVDSSRRTVLSALLKGMTDYSVSSSAGNLVWYKKTAVSLPLGVHDFLHIFEVINSTGRWYLEEEQQGMRRDPEEIEGVTLHQVYNDPVLKRNQKLYHSCVRDVKSRGTLSATLFPMKHVGIFLCTIASDLGRATFERPCFTSSWCECCLLTDSDESKSPCLKVMMWNLRKDLRH